MVNSSSVRVGIALPGAMVIQSKFSCDHMSWASTSSRDHSCIYAGGVDDRNKWLIVSHSNKNILQLRWKYGSPISATIAKYLQIPPHLRLRTVSMTHEACVMTEKRVAIFWDLGKRSISLLTLISSQVVQRIVVPFPVSPGRKSLPTSGMQYIHTGESPRSGHT